MNLLLNRELIVINYVSITALIQNIFRTNYVLLSSLCAIMCYLLQLITVSITTICERIVLSVSQYRYGPIHVVHVLLLPIVDGFKVVSHDV
jgi:NADH:ubiquinone oxidoreductase subunit H